MFTQPISLKKKKKRARTAGIRNILFFKKIKMNVNGVVFNIMHLGWIMHVDSSISNNQLKNICIGVDKFPVEV